MIAPVILIVACLLLAATAFFRLQHRPLPPDNSQFLMADVIGVPASPVEREEAVNSVLGQLKAFHHDDYKRAMYYDSSWMRVTVGDPEDFRSMMVNYYPDFTNYTKVNIGDVRSISNGTQVSVPISVTGKDGYTVNAVYMMARSNDGVYRVTGVIGGRR